MSIIDRLECEMNNAHDWLPVFRDDDNELVKGMIRGPDDFTFLDWECRYCGDVLLDENLRDKLDIQVHLSFGMMNA